MQIHPAIISAIGTLALAQAVHGSLIAYEGFDYSAGTSIATQNGGSGFVGTWTGSGTGATQTVESPGLVGAASSIGGRLSLNVTGSSNSNASRQILSSTQSTGTVYLSTTMRLDAGNSVAYGYLQLNDVNSNTPVRIGFAAGGKWYISSPYNGNAKADSSTAVITGTDAKVVAKIDFDANTADLWVNPTTSIGTPDATVLMGSSSYIRFDRMSLRTQCSSSTSTTIGSFDEIRLGTELADVVTVPEPMAAGLAGLASCLLAVRRRRS